MPFLRYATFTRTSYLIIIWLFIFYRQYITVRINNNIICVCVFSNNALHCGIIIECSFMLFISFCPGIQNALNLVTQQWVLSYCSSIIIARPTPPNDWSTAIATLQIRVLYFNFLKFLPNKVSLNNMETVKPVSLCDAVLQTKNLV